MVGVSFDRPPKNHNGYCDWGQKDCPLHGKKNKVNGFWENGIKHPRVRHPTPVVLKLLPKEG